MQSASSVQAEGDDEGDDRTSSDPPVRAFDGDAEGIRLGSTDGNADGVVLDSIEGEADGMVLGSSEGIALGSSDGGADDDRLRITTRAD